MLSDSSEGDRVGASSASRKSSLSTTQVSESESTLATAATRLHDSLRVGRPELLVIPALTVCSLNSEGGLGILVSRFTKSAALLLAIAAAILLVVRSIRSTRRWERREILPILYAGVVLASSIKFILPEQRYLLLGQFLALVFVFIVFAALRPHKFFGAVYWAGCLHVFLALSSGVSTQWTAAEERLSGGVHPIQLGFDSAAVLLVALTVLLTARQGPVRPLTFFVCSAGAIFALIGSYSRQSLLGAAGALVLLAILWPGQFRLYRALVVTTALVMASVLVDPSIWFGLLREQDGSGLISATGRGTIWERLLAVESAVGLLGFGFVSLSDRFGPDNELFRASLGHNAENALMQVAIDAGWLGLAVWVAIFVGLLFRVFRSPGTFRVLGICFLPILLTSLWASSGMSGSGQQWWWLLALSEFLRPVNSQEGDRL